MKYATYISYIVKILDRLKWSTLCWINSVYTLLHIHYTYLHSWACLWIKILMFQWAGMRKGEKPLPLAFRYLILMIWRPCDFNLVMISSLVSKWQDFKFWLPVFQPFYEMKLKTTKFKVFRFEASEDIMTKFESQYLYIIKIKYWSTSGSLLVTFLQKKTILELHSWLCVYRNTWL